MKFFQNTKLGFRVVLVASLLALMVVGLGAFTRLVDAGLGCPDWPTCYGHLWVPNSDSEIAAANEKFAHAPVETHKTWPEQLHRIFASSLGLFCLALVYLSVKRVDRKIWLPSVSLLSLLVFGAVARIILGDVMDPFLWVLVAVYFAYLVKSPPSPDGRPLRLPLLIAGLVLLQGFFGMWTVTLNLWPQVVTLHLLGGFSTLSLLWLLTLRLSGWPEISKPVAAEQLVSLSKLALVTLVVVIVQIMLGGWTTSNYAALACPDFPTCQGAWWPETDFPHGFNIFQHIGPNYLGGTMDATGRIAIHLTHRIGAVLTAVFCLWLAIRLYWVELKGLSLTLAGLLLVQITLGISNVVFLLPLWVAVSHNAVAAILLLWLVTINYRLHREKVHV